jgi:adenylate cyclase
MRGFLMFTMLASLMGVYLFVSAPPPLAEPRAHEGTRISVRELFELVAAENAAVRQLYTQEIVAAGKRVGLRFDEKWRDEDVEAGPLPALFLRETSQSLDRSGSRLGLFLGSDFPIRRANLFTGASAAAFSQLRKDRAPRYFYMDDVSLHTAMFPDLAVAQACVDCHNEHLESAKHDWQLDDVMGATTWTYPNRAVSLHEVLSVLAALRSGFKDAYDAYLVKARGFKTPPEIGSKWPANGYYLPTTDTFMQEVERRTSGPTLQRLMNAS